MMSYKYAYIGYVEVEKRHEEIEWMNVMSRSHTQSSAQNFKITKQNNAEFL